MTKSSEHRWDVGSIPTIEPEALAGIVGAVADLSVVLSVDGLITAVLSNPFHGAVTDLNGWLGSSFKDLLTRESGPKFDRALAAFRTTGGPIRATELNHRDPRTGAEFPVSYSFHDIGPDGAILLLGRDLRPISDMQQQLVNAQIAVERDYERQRGFDTRFRVLMHAVPDAVVFVSVASGTIDDVNGAAASLFGRTAEELKGSAFAGLFDGPGHSELMADLAAAALADGTATLPLLLRRGRRKVTLMPSFFRAAGNRMMMCRLVGEARDGLPRGDTPMNLSALYEAGPDGIVFTAPTGAILSANDAFLSMIEASGPETVRGKTLSDFLDRGAMDQRVLLDHATRSGRMRNYAATLRGLFGTTRPAEIAATHINRGDDDIFGFVIRDVSVSEAVRGDDSLPARSGPVSALVGTTPLKDIVAETTEVIEKTCIETALDLTGDNRVAAAEMLGLSRQSLYVKLRKYDLLGKGDKD